jgi:putative two-component system response regulator
VRVLVVDDDVSSLITLDGFLTELGYEVATSTNGREAFELIQAGDYRIVISDWEMPDVNGLELCQSVRRRRFGSYVYFILLTCRTAQEDLVLGLNAGADDFIRKPFEPDELQVRLNTAVRICSLESRDILIFSLAKLAESRDCETGAHLERMREYSRILAEELSHYDRFKDVIDADYIRTIYLTSPLHDIGKVGIPDRILLKPGRLTKEEFEVMKQHTLIAGTTLAAAVENNPSASFFRLAQEIALTHHERYDGQGYPHGLAGDDIALCGRIVSVADVYDALTTRRVYKPAYSHATARQIIIENSGKAFDPDIVSAFLAREDDFIAVKSQLDRSVGISPASELVLECPRTSISGAPC